MTATPFFPNDTVYYVPCVLDLESKEIEHLKQKTLGDVNRISSLSVDDERVEAASFTDVAKMELFFRDHLLAGIKDDKLKEKALNDIYILFGHQEGALYPLSTAIQKALEDRRWRFMPVPKNQNKIKKHQAFTSTGDGFELTERMDAPCAMFTDLDLKIQPYNVDPDHGQSYVWKGSATIRVKFSMDSNPEVTLVDHSISYGSERIASSDPVIMSAIRRSNLFFAVGMGLLVAAGVVAALVLTGGIAGFAGLGLLAAVAAGNAGGIAVVAVGAATFLGLGLLAAGAGIRWSAQKQFHKSMESKLSNVATNENSYRAFCNNKLINSNESTTDSKTSSPLKESKESDESSNSTNTNTNTNTNTTKDRVSDDLTQKGSGLGP